jgi:hypothetical protein
MNAMMSYESISRDDLGLEGFTLMALFLASTDSEVSPQHPLYGIVKQLRTMNDDERLAFCSFQLSRPREAGL